LLVGYSMNFLSVSEHSSQGRLMRICRGAFGRPPFIGTMQHRLRHGDAD